MTETTTGTFTTTAEATAPTGRYNYAIGYLRAFIVVLVIAHHSALAYHPYAPPPAATLDAQGWWQAFPVVDHARWSGFTTFVGFNDLFFMSLMFFLSGLFFWQGLERKRIARFLRDRLLRLGLPFLVATAFFAPLAYYPSYLEVTQHTGFWHQWFALSNWPAGPAWFVWVLLAFDSIAALLFTRVPTLGQWLRQFIARVSANPALFFASLIAISAIIYVPLALLFGPLAWASTGPFAFQISRILHYFAYFVVAIGVGAWGLNRGLLTPGGKLAKRWPLWVITALLMFALSAASSIFLAPHAPSPALAIAQNATFVLSCAASCFAFLAIFLRFARSRSPLWDSLTANSYGIYLVHYMFVSWLQYALLPASLPAVAKFAIVFTAAFLLSWATSVMLRRIPAVARVV